MAVVLTRRAVLRRHLEQAEPLQKDVARPKGLIMAGRP